MCYICLSIYTVHVFFAALYKIAWAFEAQHNEPSHPALPAHLTARGGFEGGLSMFRVDFASCKMAVGVFF